MVEVWTHKDLHVPVLTKTTTPHGVQTERLSNVKPGEPPASMFQIPPNYKVMHAPNFAALQKPKLPELKLPKLPNIPKIQAPKLPG